MSEPIERKNGMSPQKNWGRVLRNCLKFNEIGGDFSFKDPPPRSPSLRFVGRGRSAITT